MASIGTDYSFLFSNLSSSSSKSTSGGFFSTDNTLADYASIKNGSYAKLLKAYYGQSSVTADSEETRENNTKLSKVKNSAETLTKAADDLTSSSLYSKGSFETTLSDGSKIESEYDMDKIYEKASAFTDSYNSAIKAGAAFDSGNISTRTLSLISMTSKNSSLLNKVGISIGKDGDLSIDQDKFKKADIGTIKSLFSGTGSYADSVANKSSIISSLASNKISGNSSYNSSGSYSSSSDAASSLFNGTV